MTEQKSKLTMILILALGILWATGATAQLTVLNTNVPAGFGQAGYIQAATLDTATGGGTLTMNGITMIVPANSVVQFPANTLAWADLFDTGGNLNLVPVYDPNLGAAPPNLLITCSLFPCTGLALSDNAAQIQGHSPWVPFNAIVLGNIDVKNVTGHGVGAYIVGLILPIGQDLGNGGAGFITCIDYKKGRFEVGGKLSTALANVCGATPTGTVIEINDPSGRYGWAHSPDPRWSVDPDNPTITAGNGYPMCLPTVVPPAVDPDCPIYNRPRNTTGDPFLQIGAPLMVVTMPPSSGPGKTKPDPWKPAPLMVGDFVAYSGVLYKDIPGAAINPLKPWNQQTYISANTVGADKVEVITAPCPSGTTGPCTASVGPAYVALERMVIGTGGTSITVLPNGALGIAGGTIPLPEPRTNIVINGFVTDSTNLVDIFAVDINPSNGAETHRLLGTVLPEPGFPGGRGNKGRFRFDVGKGNWGNRTRVYMAQSRHGTVRVPDQTGTIHPPEGLLSGQYHAPMFTFQFADAPPGFPIIPQNFNTMPFLTQGEGGNLSNGPLKPFPPFCPPVSSVPTCQP